MDTSHKRSRSLGEPGEAAAAVLESLVDPNFEELARQFPAFGAAWRTVEGSRKAARGKLSAHITQEFSVALTKALLQVQFGISLTNLPLHHLCPPVPNRYFYVQWIQNKLLPLLQHPDYFEQGCRGALERPATAGLDIGTGPVCIYPLLYCASCIHNDDVVNNNNNNNIIMYATDIDPAAVELAQDNVNSNPSLRSKIRVSLVPGSDRQLQQPEQQQQHEMEIESNQTARVRKGPSEGVDPLLFPVGPLRRSMEHIIPYPTLGFSMTNPPFYDNDESASSSARTGDGREGTAMTSNEGSYPGGEVGFCLDMIVDGLYFFLQQRRQQRSSLAATNAATQPMVNMGPPGWSSSMCGKKSSLVLLQHVVTQLLGPAHVCDTEFGPGQMTRWFLAWTFQRPVIRSPLAKHSGWTFDVALPLHTTGAETDGACHEVLSRIQEYCRITSNLGVTCDIASNDANKQRLEIRESSIMAQSWKGDDALPERIKNIMQQQDVAVRMEFLPVEGHFLIDVTVVATPSVVQVRVEAYQHSVYGKKVVEKIKSQLESEVCRTNRKWRRQLQRQHPQGSTMDESR